MLQADETPVYEILQKEAPSPFLFTADHAGRLIPRALGDLGITDSDLTRHIAWDIGIAGITRQLSAVLNATSILQNYSRLVIDCNRAPSVPSAFPEVSEATPIPGNQNLSPAAKQARQDAIFNPYHHAISQLITHRAKTIYIAMHSFTPVYLGQVRPMQVAVLYNHMNPRLSEIMAALLRAEGNLVVAENAPYKLSPETDYGVPTHAHTRGLDYLELEIRQDLITSEAGQAEWTTKLARLLPLALQALNGN